MAKKKEKEDEYRKQGLPPFPKGKMRREKPPKEGDKNPNGIEEHFSLFPRRREKRKKTKKEGSETKPKITQNERKEKK